VHDSAGLYLYGSCWWGGYSHLVTREVENFPAWRVAEPAHALECGGRDTHVRMKTLWVVSPTEGTFSWDSRTGEYSLRPLSADDSATLYSEKSAGPPTGGGACWGKCTRNDTLRALPPSSSPM